MDPIAIDQISNFRCQNFDATQIGVKDLFDTQPTPFLPHCIVIMLRAVSGFVSVPTISLGTNAPNYDNVLAASPMAALDVAGECFRLPVGTQIGTTGIYRLNAPGSSVSLKANVTVPAVATQYVVEVIVEGGYV
jgi:hypothetical protein